MCQSHDPNRDTSKTALFQYTNAPKQQLQVDMEGPVILYMHTSAGDPVILFIL